MTLKEFMTLAEIFATTIFSVKLMHDCILAAKIGGKRPGKINGRLLLQCHAVTVYASKIYLLQDDTLHACKQYLLQVIKPCL